MISASTPTLTSLSKMEPSNFISSTCDTTSHIRLTTRIPANTLIAVSYTHLDVYKRQPVFRYAEETFIASGTPTADTGLTLEMSAEYTEKSYEYLDRKLRERPCYIQHTEEDFQVIIADLQLGQGFVCTLSNGEESTALAITYPIEMCIRDRFLTE